MKRVRTGIGWLVATVLAGLAVTGCGSSPSGEPEAEECGADLDCDDGRACTVDECVEGVCVHQPRTGSVCDDGNPCTTGARCDDEGVCSGGEPVELPSDPCRSCSCDPDTGIECTAQEPQTSCDDGDCCTEGDVCLECDPADEDCPEWGRICSGEPKSCDDDEPCTDDACVCEGGEATCEHEPVPDETSCDRNPNDCTVGDACHDGECRLGAPAELDDGNPCTKDRCEKGEIVHEPLLEGDCDDGNECTVGDHCELGVCVGEAPLECDTPTCASSASCKPGQGCVPVWKPEGAVCDDDNPCTEAGVCNADHECTGVSIRECDDGNPCTADSCVAEEGGCVHEPVEGPCEDGNPCTTGDTCVDGVCEPGTTGLDCDDGNPCTEDSCAPGEGGCVHEPIGGSCDDGNPCTIGDYCADGACQPGTATPDCDDGNPCTEDACAPAQGPSEPGGCVHEPLTGPGCDDGDPCTTDDHCEDGACVSSGGGAEACDDGNPCTEDYCDPVEGCVRNPIEGPCDDGDPCTFGDQCVDGDCEPETSLDCDDGQSCSIDQCQPTGCVYEFTEPASTSCWDVRGTFHTARWVHDPEELEIFGETVEPGETVHAHLDGEADDTYATEPYSCPGYYDSAMKPRAWDVERKPEGPNTYRLHIRGQSDEDCGQGQPISAGTVEVNDVRGWAITEVLSCSVSNDDGSNGETIDTWCEVDPASGVISWQSGSTCGGCCACPDGAGVDIEVRVSNAP